MEKTTTLVLALVVALLGGGQAGAQRTLEQLYKELRRSPGIPVMTPTQRFDLVNERLEPEWGRDQRDLLIREMTYAPPGWNIRIFDRQGTERVRGRCGDLECTTAQGDFIYFDANGVMRARGWFTNGLKCGTWQRWDAHGNQLPDKRYAGLEWDDMQVELGIASRAELWVEFAEK